jgi:hypothetical protein
MNGAAGILRGCEINRPVRRKIDSDKQMRDKSREHPPGLGVKELDEGELKPIVFQRVGIGYDGFALLIDKNAESAGIPGCMEQIIYAGFPVHPNFVSIGDALAVNFDKAIVLTHSAPPDDRNLS